MTNKTLTMTVAGLLSSALTIAYAQSPTQPPTPANLAFAGPNATILANESYKLAGLSGNFWDWMRAAYKTAGVPLGDGKAATLDDALAARRAALQAAKTPTDKDALARDTAAWAHKFIKKVVPKFSLERGYEFASIVKTGERQCLLQSTVITGLLQKAGFDSGLVMVWKSMAGQESNLGHVTSELRLPSGAGDVQVDASEPAPFATHSGLLAWVDGGYRFIDAQFAPGHDKDGLITSYTREDGKGSVKPAALTFLPLSYVRSQYDYYRAERAIGGVLGTGTGKSTPDGLKTSAKYLQLALKEDPQNALASSVLGTVLRKQGQMDAAKAQYKQAASLYAAQGHSPASITSNLAWANRQGQ